MGKGYIGFAAAFGISLLATPMVMGITRALATPEENGAVAQVVEVAPVEITPVPAATAPEACARKVRVVYSGYARGACEK